MAGLIVASGLGFSDAWDMTPGGQVVYGGRLRTVVHVEHTGKDAPLFYLGGTGWVSWQVCGSAPVRSCEHCPAGGGGCSVCRRFDGPTHSGGDR
jgi:hypothetical protein